MTIREAAESIKGSVPSREIAVIYGYTPNRSGYIGCPFHGEKTPSLKLHSSGWYCYGCGAGGSVIDFVIMHDRCTFAQAVQAIDRHFALGLLKEERLTLAQSRRQKKERDAFERRKEIELNRLKKEIAMVDEEMMPWWQMYSHAIATPALERTAKQWFDMENAKEWCMYYEDRIRTLEAQAEEVRRWRMETPRAGSA